VEVPLNESLHHLFIQVRVFYRDLSIYPRQQGNKTFSSKKKQEESEATSSMDITDAFRDVVRERRKEGGLKMHQEEILKPSKRRREEASPYLATAMSIVR